MISTVLCLLPMVFGILVYGKLPDEIPTKWYSDGTVGQYMPKAFTVFGMPIFFAAINGLVHFSMNTDPKKQNIGSMVKMIGKWVIPVLAMAAIPTAILFFAAINGLVHFSMNTDPKKQNIGSMVKMIGKWVIPVLAMAAIPTAILWGMGIEIPMHFSMNTDPKKQNIGSMVKMIGKWVIPVLAMAAIPTAILWGMGIEIPIDRILPVILGIVFVLIGNYFPKCRRNYTTGIKTPWALDSDENWRKTHHDRILPVILGIVFVLIGNYFPKCRRNYTTGIKTPWALDSDENWRKTHHMAAFLWIAAGLVMIAQVFLPGKIGMIAMGIMVVLLIILPYAYSYILYRKGI